ncbi:hypothetical protein [Massilia sp. CFBP9026]|uniref:HNH endonuclease n=1 Tax=Massilia sp. CFBP9026 TaxID=3096536 RepID=UPI002A6A2D1F|nr:hypothetical protein [Massilia sp. CFBP9026]MDY0961776.1 hypothetical protein [Massilia sp. CFBP9026]
MFLFPKSKHIRSQKPRVFKRYGSYKRYLQAEFSRLCVYCRQPDSSAPNLNYGADHYRPKSVPRFASLVCSYDNLYYCCGSCNSRKNDYWPFDEVAGPYIVNPCEFEMASHLRFDSSSGRIEPRSDHGKHTEELLQLNDPASVQYRLGTLTTVRLYNKEIEDQRKLLLAIEKLYKDGVLSLEERDLELTEVRAEIESLTRTLQSHTGELPLKPLRSKKLGVSLIVA